MNDPSIIKEIWQRLKPYRGRLFVSLGFLLVSVPLAQVHPLVWKYAVDDVLIGNKIHLLWVPIVVMGLAQFIATITAALHGFFLEQVGQAFVRDTRNEIFSHLSGQTLSYHHDRKSGDLMTRVVSDVEAMENSVLRGLVSLLEEMLTFIIVAGIVIYLQPVIGLCTMIPLVLSFIAIKIFGSRVKHVYERAREQLGEIGFFIQDRLGGIQLTQAYGKRNEERSSFEKANKTYYQSSIDALKLKTTIMPVIGAFGFMSNIIMLGMGIWFVWKGEFTMGGLIAYRGYWWRLQSPINTLARTSDIIMKARAAARRVLQILHDPVEIVSPENPVSTIPQSGNITFKNVSFRYSQSRPVLEEISFDIRAGEFVAIAGRSGSGKSTLLNLIPRFYEAQEGIVTVDSHKVGDYELDQLRRGIGMVMQETYLFNASILENIRYAKPDATMEDVQKAAAAANATEFIFQLPNGYDTIVGERGVKLSGGQRQRISLARVFLFNPPILLLDEPTSAVEPGSEELIHQSILNLSQGRTTLLVTHRVTLLRKVSRILFLEQGKIIADGSHDRLIEICPEYVDAYHRWEMEEEKR